MSSPIVRRWRKVDFDDDGAPSRTPPSTEDTPHGDMPAASRAGGRVFSAERKMLVRLLHELDNPPIQISLFNGEVISTNDERPVACVVIHDRATLWKLLVDPNFQFGEGYADGRIEVDGSLAALLEIVYRKMSTSGCAINRARAAVNWLGRRAHSLSGSRKAIRQHYDLSNEFYRLWLDRQMVYSCAYFTQEPMSLDAAQEAKLDYVGVKLDLRPGETVLDIGGGWGATALHLARRFGVRVTALNISREQLDFSRHRAEAEGMTDRVDFVEADYREATGQFDAIVSLGMLEHVGARQYDQFGRTCDRCLKSHGRGLIQTIGQNVPEATNPWIDKYIFPGGYLPSPTQLMTIFETGRFSVLDVENLGWHYARTLAHWLARFNYSEREVAGMFDARFVRLWRLYLTGSMVAFSTGVLQLFQVVFSRPPAAPIRWTRAGLYREPTATLPPWARREIPAEPSKVRPR